LRSENPEGRITNYESREDGAPRLLGAKRGEEKRGQRALG